MRTVVLALFLRELKTRFGNYRLGYLWALLEPGAHLLVLMLIFGFVIKRTMPGISFMLFLLNGIILFFIFSNATSRAIGAIEANQGLFNYRPVKPIDTIIARTLLELLIYTSVYFILLWSMDFLGEQFVIGDFLTLLTIWTLVVIFSLGIALLFMVGAHQFPESQMVLPLLTRPLYFISCIMYSLNNIPQEFHQYLLWNPLLHAIELSRNIMLPGYQVQEVSLTYLFFSSLIALFIGLAFYKLRERKMLTSS